MQRQHRIRSLALLALLASFGSLACDLLTGPTEHRFQDLVAGGSHNCARSVSGQWFCWGEAQVDRAGVGADGGDWTRPRPLSEDPGLVTVSAGEVSTCGLTAAGRVYCWGRNHNGSLGLGFLGGERESPTPVETELRFDELANTSTPTHFCGLADGRSYCWGNNFRRQLGAGILADYHPFVEPVLGGHRFELISTEVASTCALNDEGDVYCWGALVPGRENDLNEPALVAEAMGFDTLVSANGVRCGLRSHVAYCHGINTTGALGTGDTLPREGFVAVAGGHSFRSLTAGRIHLCGITPEDAAYCWGPGIYGRLGNGSEEDALVPVRVAGDQRWAMLAAGGEHTCGLTVAGEVYCWGRGLWGQLGNGSTEDHFVPTKIAIPVH